MPVSDNVVDIGRDAKSTPKGFKQLASGGNSRMYSLDAWSKLNIPNLPKIVRKVFPFLFVPKPDKREKDKGLKNKEKPVTDGNIRANPKTAAAYQANSAPRRNSHPTTKPIQLFSYLITLGSREGDLILDPFIGSGTAAISAKLLNRNYIGIEQNEEYLEIAKSRIQAWKRQISINSYMEKDKWD